MTRIERYAVTLDNIRRAVRRLSEETAGPALAWRYGLFRTHLVAAMPELASAAEEIGRLILEQQAARLPPGRARRSHRGKGKKR